jgi:hypothetical protein
MRLFEKHGLVPDSFTGETLEYYKEGLKDSFHVIKDTYSVEDRKADSIFFSARICFYYYFTEEKENIDKYARPMLDYAIEYFFGEWRKSTPVDGNIGEELLKRSELWIRYFRESILWATVLGEWEKAREIAKYPDELSMEADFESKEKKAWYIVLAVYLREGGLQNARRYIRIIETGRKKREKLLLNVLRAIEKKDPEQFAKEFNKYLKYYKAYEFPKDLIPEKLAIDGTILFNLAREQGMEVEFPQQYIDHYIKLGANTPVSIR